MIENKEQFGEYGIEVKGITIHNTGNSKSAKENYEWMTKTKRTNATHFFVDEVETIQAMPLDWHVWHTGKGRDFGNMKTISIEICRSQSSLNTYLKAQSRAFLLIQELMRTYELGFNDIYFHIDFDPHFYCPHKILDLYGSKHRFKEVMKNEL